jgi:hypothetical protein
VGRLCVHVHILSACLPFCKRISRSRQVGPRVFTIMCVAPRYANSLKKHAKRWKSITLYVTCPKFIYGAQEAVTCTHILYLEMPMIKNLGTCQCPYYRFQCCLWISFAHKLLTILRMSIVHVICAIQQLPSILCMVVIHFKYEYWKVCSDSELGRTLTLESWAMYIEWPTFISW